MSIMTDCGCNNFPASLGTVTFEGSVGIGTSAPAETLELGSGGTVGVRIDPGDASPGLTAYALRSREAGGTLRDWRLYAAPVGGGYGVVPNSFSIWDYPGQPGPGTGSNPRLVLLPTPNGASTAPAQVTIDGAGRLGVGTATPGVALEADGDRELLRLVGQTTEFIGFFNGGTPNAFLGVGQNGTLLTGAGPDSLCLRANTSMHLGSGGDGLTLTITGGGGGQPGNVGIGTTTPAAPLAIAKGTATATNQPPALLVGGDISAETPAAKLMLADTSGSGNPWFEWQTVAGSPSRLRLNAGSNGSATGADLVSVTSAGNVGIGTTSPGYPLDVAGTARLTGILLGGDQLMSGALKDSTGNRTNVDAGGCYYAD